jgi:hypothetical protein
MLHVLVGLIITLLGCALVEFVKAARAVWLEVNYPPSSSDAAYFAQPHDNDRQGEDKHSQVVVRWEAGESRPWQYRHIPGV